MPGDNEHFNCSYSKDNSDEGSDIEDTSDEDSDIEDIHVNVHILFHIPYAGIFSPYEEFAVSLNVRSKVLNQGTSCMILAVAMTIKIF